MRDGVREENPRCPAQLRGHDASTASRAGRSRRPRCWRTGASRVDKPTSSAESRAAFTLPKDNCPAELAESRAAPVSTLPKDSCPAAPESQPSQWSCLPHQPQPASANACSTCEKCWPSRLPVCVQQQDWCGPGRLCGDRNRTSRARCGLLAAAVPRWRAPHGTRWTGKSSFAAAVFTLARLRTSHAGRESPHSPRQSPPRRGSARVTLGGKVVIRGDEIRSAPHPVPQRSCARESPPSESEEIPAAAGLFFPANVSPAPTTSSPRLPDRSTTIRVQRRERAGSHPSPFGGFPGLLGRATVECG